MSAADLWASAWARLASEHHDLDDRLAAVERCPSVARAMASAGRESGRLQRGTGDLAELERRLQAFEAAVLAALASQDDAKSRRLCLDCGDGDAETVLPGLTSGRVCARCLRESTPITATCEGTGAT